MEDWFALLGPLVAAQDGLARLESAVEASSEDIGEGLLARMACREAAGWLAQQGVWVHPVDLALREAGVTGSYGAAELGVRLGSVMPATVRTMELLEPPEDRDVAAALRQGRLWRRLAEMRGWAPEDLPEISADVPALIAAGQVVRESRLGAVLAAAWVWRERGGTGRPGMPFWSAPVQMVQRLALLPRAEFLVGFLGVVTAAAGLARRELGRLGAAEIRASGIAGTARSRLPEAVGLVLRRPVVTARMVADGLGLSHRGGLDVVERLVAGGVLREATGRRAWRAFVIGEEVR